MSGMRQDLAGGAWMSAGGRHGPDGSSLDQDRSPVRERRALLARGLLACTAVAALLAGTWFVGTHNVSGPSRDGIIPRKIDTYRVGWIIREDYDGAVCSYSPFDTVTEQVGDVIFAMCETALRRQKASTRGGFAWGSEQSR
jgi:hypothetical protein